MATVLETFSDCVNEVLSFGFNDGPQVNRERIKRWVNEAQQQVARQTEAAEFQATETLTLTQGTYKYPLPASFLRMQDIYYPEMLMRLRPVDLQQFDGFGPKVIEGPPWAYTIYASELWVYPTPFNSTDTLELRFIKRPANLVADADVPTVNKDYLHLLVEFAVIKAFAAEDDQEAAQAHTVQFKADLAAYATDMQRQTVDRPRIVDGTWGGSGGYSGGRMI